MSRKHFGYVTSKGKAIRKSVMDLYAVKEIEKSDESRALKDAFRDSYNQLGLVEPIYSPDKLDGVLEINTYHKRCVATKARDVAGLGFALSPIGDDVSDANEQTIKDFIENQKTLLSETLYRQQHDIESVGYGVIELVRVGYISSGLPQTLTHIPAHSIRRHRDGNRAMQKRGKNKRWFKIAGVASDIDKDDGTVHAEGSLPVEKRASEVMWSSSYSSRSDFYGQPDWIASLGTIAGDFSRREYNRTFFDSYGVPAYAVFITGNFDPGEEDDKGRTDLEKSIEEHFDEIAKNPHSTLILTLPTTGGDGEVKVEFKPLATDVKEASFRMYRVDNRDEVVTAHGVPPYRIGVMVAGQMAGNMAIEATEIYKSSVLEPRQLSIENMINKLIIRDGFGVEDWKFELAEIDTKDEKHESEFLTTLFKVGAVTPNEIRMQFASRFGLSQVDNNPALDWHYIDGQPIGVDDPMPGVVERALKSLRADIEIATKGRRR
jgi:PBSX family phage portal protein